MPSADLATVISSSCSAVVGQAEPVSHAAAATAAAAERTIYVRCVCEWSGFRCLRFAFLDTGETDAWRCMACVDASLPCCRCYCEACFPEDDYDPSEQPFGPGAASVAESVALARADETFSPTAAGAQTDDALAIAPVLLDYARVDPSLLCVERLEQERQMVEVSDRQRHEEHHLARADSSLTNRTSELYSGRPRMAGGAIPSPSPTEYVAKRASETSEIVEQQREALEAYGLAVPKTASEK